ncbi:Protein slit [Papilio xuthus]|uniref:Protein slit n=1 Tax=Papilio xuthus TaxID=66420 RepID=A0A0N1IAG4_PAPXU|nr:Protein slit [Papilio xuthus]
MMTSVNRFDEGRIGKEKTLFVHLLRRLNRGLWAEITSPFRRLEQNEITEVGAGAFVAIKVVARIDLSNNKIVKIAADAFNGLTRLTSLGLTSLKSLHLDGNHLKCIDDKALEHMKSLEVLTLNSNNLTYLSLEPASVARLHTLRLTDNPVVCDCRVARLLVALRSSAFVGVGARCQAPATLRGALLTDLEDSDLICSGEI